MSTLTILGMASFLFVVAFTARALRLNTGAGQTPRGAIIEVWVSIIVGFAFNYVANFWLIPMMHGGGSLSAVNNWWGGWVYTAISLLRQYLVRRASNMLQFVGRTT